MDIGSDPDVLSWGRLKDRLLNDNVVSRLRYKFDFRFPTFGHCESECRFCAGEPLERRFTFGDKFVPNYMYLLSFLGARPEK